MVKCQYVMVLFYNLQVLLFLTCMAVLTGLEKNSSQIYASCFTFPPSSPLSPYPSSTSYSSSSYTSLSYSPYSMSHFSYSCHSLFLSSSPYPSSTSYLSSSCTSLSSYPSYTSSLYSFCTSLYLYSPTSSTEPLFIPTYFSLLLISEHDPNNIMNLSLSYSCFSLFCCILVE